MRRPTLMVLCGAISLAACADDPVGPPPMPGTMARLSQGGAPANSPERVGVLGVLVDRSGPTLVLKDRDLEFEPGPHVNVASVEQRVSIGDRGGEVLVVTDESTAFYVNGERVASVEEVPLEAHLLVLGKADGGALQAEVVADLSGFRPPTELEGGAVDSPEVAVALAAASSAEAEALVTASTVSLCFGADMDYDNDPTVHEFQGCWGGPSATGFFQTDLDVACLPGVGCVVLDKIGFTYALGGWAFAFPFRFTASSPGLVYHQPGSVSLLVQSLPASGVGFTFAGGLGFTFAFEFDACNVLGCTDLRTIDINAFSMIHRTTNAGPLRPQDRMDIDEVGCPSLGSIGFVVLDVGLCIDLGMTGQPFRARLKTNGQPGGQLPFDGTSKTVSVRPDALSVKLEFDEFEWIPILKMGAYVRLKILTQEVLRTPTLSITDGGFAGVTTPFPGPDFSIATDPLSPVGDIRYLPQPTSATVAQLSVSPAPTNLTILSPNTMEEGAAAVRARLTESYDGSSIQGVLLVFTITSETGTRVESGITDVAGVAQTILPNGEHSVTVRFAGSGFYQSSSATQSPIYVYRATTFVIWGGNPGGVVAGERYNFWGSQWRNQVTGGAFDANGRFKGYAFSVTGGWWIGGPGNSVPPSDAVSRFISVIVATVMTNDGPNTVGNVATRVVLRVEDPASYAPDPGHQAWGVMTAELGGTVPIT